MLHFSSLDDELDGILSGVDKAGDGRTCLLSHCESATADRALAVHLQAPHGNLSDSILVISIDMNNLGRAEQSFIRATDVSNLRSHRHRL